MSQTIQAIYENGFFRPLASVDLPEKSVVEFDFRVTANQETVRQQVRNIFQTAGLSRPLNLGVKKSSITNERRTELAEKFTAEQSLGEYINEDREGRG
jgi:predicted DNA-binding antitoxin AbrB/MazE fold protein